jgi:hypothetical protein
VTSLLLFSSATENYFVQSNRRGRLRLGKDGGGLRLSEEMERSPAYTGEPLRHLLASNIHPEVVQERLGHTSIAITMDNCSHPVPNMRSEAACDC